MSRVMRRSIEFALTHRKDAVDHAMIYARDLDIELADKFVGMYVNDLTLDLGERGKKGHRANADLGRRKRIYPPSTAARHFRRLSFKFVRHGCQP